VLSQERATDIDISSLADGIYLVRLYDESGILVKTDKLVKASN
jgi:hypothetical protein